MYIHRVSALADIQTGSLVVEASADIDEADLEQLPENAGQLIALTWLGDTCKPAAGMTPLLPLLDPDQLAPGEFRCRRLTKDMFGQLVLSYREVASRRRPSPDWPSPGDYRMTRPSLCGWRLRLVWGMSLACLGWSDGRQAAGMATRRGRP